MPMKTCECCGNTYDKAFELIICCAHGARTVGIDDVADRAPDHGAAPP